MRCELKFGRKSAAAIMRACLLVQLHDLASFIANVKKQCPKLRYLSILKNPCCPNFLVSGGKDMHDYQLYRYFVLHQLQTLKFLDFQAVNPQELADAKRKGQFMGVAKPRSSGGSAASESSTKVRCTPLP